MSGNSFGQIFKVSTYGESHGESIGVVIHGCPPLLPLSSKDIYPLLKKRRPGQSEIVSQRKEEDRPEIISGVIDGKTSGAPIHIRLKNKDARPADYTHISKKFRPSHADYTYQSKYGIRDVRGGGRSSARITACWVAAGAVAMKLLSTRGIKIRAWVNSISGIAMAEKPGEEALDRRYENAVRCPDKSTAEKMYQLIEKTQKDGDTLGGTIACTIENVPVGLGEPLEDKLHARLGQAMLSINSCKGFQIGSGFPGTLMKGSEHNDVFDTEDGMVVTKTNFSGGVQGGISNGMPVEFKVAFKPVSTIMKEQVSIDHAHRKVLLEGKGRHDPCVVPRAVPIVEALSAIVIIDFLLLSMKDRFMKEE